MKIPVADAIGLVMFGADLGVTLSNINAEKLGPTAHKLLLIAETPEKAAILNGALQRLDDLYANRKLEPQKDPYRLSSLARQIEYLAIAYSAVDRDGEPVRLRRNWAKLVADYTDFVAAMGDKITLEAEIKESDVQGVCLFSSTQKEHLYSSLVLFVSNVTETRPEIDQRLRLWLPTGELDLLSAIRARIIDGTVEAPTESEPASPFPYVRMNFAYETDYRATFDQFVGKFTSGDGAHFVCYRNGLVDPSQILKSFIAIMPPSGDTDRNWHRFVHVYQAPSVGNVKKITNGIVIPLEESVYLVGGERNFRDQASRSEPFKAIEAIALDWTAIEALDPILPGLTLSSNYRWKPLVARIALRATPITESDAFPSNALDVIAAETLKANLESDLELEAKLSQSFTTDDAGRQCKTILDHINNCPTEWAVPVHYSRIGSDEFAKRDPGIGTETLFAKLDETLGSRTRPLYRSEDGVPFALRDAVRFGSLSQK